MITVIVIIVIIVIIILRKQSVFTVVTCDYNLNRLSLPVNTKSSLATEQTAHVIETYSSPSCLLSAKVTFNFTRSAETGEPTIPRNLIIPMTGSSKSNIMVRITEISTPVSQLIVISNFDIHILQFSIIINKMQLHYITNVSSL